MCYSGDLLYSQQPTKDDLRGFKLWTCLLPLSLQPSIHLMDHAIVNKTDQIIHGARAKPGVSTGIATTLRNCAITLGRCQGTGHR